MTENSPELDVLIIGGGQAGLAMGSGLKETPLSFRIVERHPRIGDSWRNRYASLVLFTPRSYSALPGLAVLGDPEGYPTKDEMATTWSPTPSASSCPWHRVPASGV